MRLFWQRDEEEHFRRGGLLVSLERWMKFQNIKTELFYAIKG